MLHSEVLSFDPETGASPPPQAASEIREHIEEVLASAGFVRSPRLSQFLRFIAGEKLAGRAGELKEYRIGTEVYGRQEGFDPVIDNIVRVEARRLRAALDRFYREEGAALSWRVEVPKGGYEPVFRRRGAEPATKAHHGGDDSIAVLPFEDFSPGRDQRHFCDGIAEEIINSLAQVRGVRVVSRTSAFAFQGQKVDVREIGEALQARAVLEGSVRKEGALLRVTAQLIDAGNGYHLWSRQFDHNADAEFAAQEEIARAIASELLTC